MKYVLFTTLLIMLSGCASSTVIEPAGDPIQEVVAAVRQQAAPSPALPPSSPSPSPTPEPQKTPAEKQLETMTAEEKAGQFFMYAFRGDGMTEFNDTMANALDKYRPAGVILFSENVRSKEQVSKLISDLQAHSKTPLFIAVDEEGGRVSRLGALYDEKLPAASTVASADEALARGRLLGQRLSELGFNMNFAPVADVNTDPDNTVIGSRAFSPDYNLAAEYVAACITGMKNEGVLPTVKHFPGHGDTKEDSHHGTAVFRHGIDRLMQVEMKPFIAGIDAGVQVVMVGHISAPQITGNDLPATFSHELIGRILRIQLGFSGVVITDAMDMGAITQYYPAGEAAVAAIEAGVDIVLMPADVDAAYSAVLDAINSGRLSSERINESVLRILKLKLPAI